MNMSVTTNRRTNENKSIGYLLGWTILDIPGNSTTYSVGAPTPSTHTQPHARKFLCRGAALRIFSGHNNPASEA